MRRLLSPFLIAALSCLTTADAQEVDSAIAVTQYIEQLSSPSFKTRERATYELWVLGEQVRDQLDQHARHADTETRQRIGFVRRMLDLQITPQTEPEIRKWIHQASEGTDRVCRTAIAKLVKAKKIELVFALLDTERSKNNADLRRRIITALTYSLRSAQANQQFSDLCLRFYQRILADPDEGVRADALNQFLTINHVRQSLGKKEWIDRLMRLLTEKHPEIIRTHVVRAYSSSSFLVALAKHDRLLDWIEAAAQMQDRRMRASYLSRILYDSNVTKYLSAESRLAELINRLSVSGRQSLLLKLTEKAELHERLYQQLGSDKLQAVYRELDDEFAAQQLLGRLIAMKFWYADAGGKEATKKVLRSATTERQKLAVTTGLLQGWQQRSSTDRKSIDPELRTVVWNMLTEEPAGWQLQPILLCYGLWDVFSSHIQIDTIDLISELVADADAESQLAFARAPTRYNMLCKQLGDEKRVLAYLRRIREVSEPAWRSSASSLCRSEQVAKALNGPQGRAGLLELVQQEKETFRYTVLSAVIDNRALLPELIKENRYDELVASFPGQRLTYQRAQLTGKLLSKQEVVDYLVKSDRVQELLVFNDPDKFSDKDKQIILGVILNSDVTVKAIMEAGHFAELDEAIATSDERQKQGLLVKLFVREPFVAMMTKHGQIGVMLRKVSDRQQHMVAIKLVDQLAKHEPHREPRLAIEFWKLIGDPKNYYDKQLALKLLSSSWFRKQVIAINQADDGFNSMLASTPPEVLEYATQSLMGGDFAVKLIEQDQFSFLIDLLRALPPQNRSRAMTRLAQSSSFRQWTEQDQNLNTLLTMIGDLDNAALQADFAGQVLCDSIFVSPSNHGPVFKHLVSFAVEQPPAIAAQMCARMLNASALQEQTLRSPLVPILLKQMEDPNQPESAALMSSILKQSTPIVLATAGHGRKFVDATLAIKDAKLRAAWQVRLFTYPQLLELMTDQEVRSAFAELTAEQPNSVHVKSLMGSAALGRLIELGYFDKLESLAETIRPGYPPVRWQFLVNATVVKRYQQHDQDAARLLDFLANCDANGVRYCLQILASSDDALNWVLRDHGWQSVDEHLARIRQNDRASVRAALLRSNAVLTHLVKQRDLSPIAEFGSDPTGLSYRRAVLVTLCRNSQIATAVKSAQFADQLVKLIKADTDQQQRDMLINSVRANRALYDGLRKGAHASLFK